MSRVSEILVRVRDSLSDNDKTRWSDSRLLRLIDEAQKDLVKDSKMLKSKVNISIVGNKAEYELPTDAYLLTRCKTDSGKIDLLTHNEMDELGALSTSSVSLRWETETGTEIEAVVYDKQNPRVFRIYPIPIDADAIADIFTITDYGITTLVEGDLMVSDYGVVTAISGSATDTTEFSSPYGLMTDMEASIASLTVQYIKLPADITSTEDVPEIDPVWDKALRYYTIAMAMADDQDTQNIKVSDKFMGLYLRELKDANATSSKSNLSSSPANSQYVRAI